MSVTELFDILIPILWIILLIVFIVFGVHLIGIALRVKKLIERVDNFSDVSAWLSLIRKLPRKKSKQL